MHKVLQPKYNRVRLVVLFKGMSTLLGSFNAKLSPFDRIFVLVWFGFMAYQPL